jgi:hypothetical protein
VSSVRFHLSLYSELIRPEELVSYLFGLLLFFLHAFLDVRGEGKVVEDVAESRANTRSKA